MKIDDLLKFITEYEPTEADVKALQERLKAAEKRFEEQAKRREITQEWLNREYTI